jgi:hypothetical protein
MHTFTLLLIAVVMVALTIEVTAQSRLSSKKKAKDKANPVTPKSNF